MTEQVLIHQLEDVQYKLTNVLELFESLADADEEGLKTRLNILCGAFGRVLVELHDAVGDLNTGYELVLKEPRENLPYPPFYTPPINLRMYSATVMPEKRYKAVATAR